ncbi:hypothetical protein K435DRAFT_778670 [Dendrothele bispora CBS 962.96]|uniref:DUF6533 domain-containing protein n=1 Tax=Dendrothele bispora (strain CBS 962.96) TaxID=1314807 RepID=A0A4S8M2A0_DENBC|nr:hypothetical protein K435DRAFT_778670 [Dendrothele bispora CBS 962.96]
MAGNLEDVEFQEVLDSWRMTRTGNSIRIASLALLLWDWVLSFEDELTLFWLQPTTFASYLFYLSRYLTMFVSIFGVAVTLSPEVTDRLFLSWFLVEGFVGMTSCWAVEIILQLRVYAIYDQSPRMKWFLVLTFVLQVSLIFLVLIITGADVGTEKGHLVVEVVKGQSSINTRCMVVSVPPWIWAFGLTMAGYEGLLGVLVIYKGFRHAKHTRYYLSHFKGEGLHEILIRDSIIYDFGIILIYAVNLFLWIEELNDAFDLATSLAIVYPSLIGSHLMFNIRRVHHKPSMNSLASSPSEISLPPFPADSTDDVAKLGVG